MKKSDSMKISIITVCYNSETTIEDTLKSVLKQKYDNYEYLIIDGKSSDNTLKIVKSYEKKFKGKMKIVSEKDKGLYDAMNKGIDLATGDVIGIINSDDVLLNENVFNMIVDNYTDDTDVLYGNVIYCDETLTNPVRDYISGNKKNNAWCPAHPTMYIRKEVFNKIGNYNLKYKITADYDFMVRLNINNIKYTYVNEYFVLMRMGGVSNGIKGYLKNFKDAYQTLRRNKVKFACTHTIIRSFKTIFQYFKSKKKKDILLDKINEYKKSFK